MKVYAVQCYRWGDFEKHSYIAGVYTDKDAAMDAAVKEEEFRGGKYACVVYGLVADKNDLQQRIEITRTEYMDECQREILEKYLKYASDSEEEEHY